MAHLALDEIEVYQKAMQFGERLQRIVMNWKWYDRSTIGIQVVKSSDSIAANISEGFGRYF